jgi:hypothetical protein
MRAGLVQLEEKFWVLGIWLRTRSVRQVGLRKKDSSGKNERQSSNVKVVFM